MLFKKSEIASKCFRQSTSAEIVEASFSIYHMAAKEKKFYNIGETLIKSCLLKVAGLVGNNIEKEDDKDFTLGFYN